MCIHPVQQQNIAVNGGRPVTLVTSYLTTFSRTPIPSIAMWIRSPLARVKSSLGTTPVPVIRNAPAGKLLSRKRYSASCFGSRLSSASVVFPANAVAPLRSISRWMVVDLLGRLRREQNARAERAASVVDLGLRQVERIFALDVARAHIVADGVADDLAAAELISSVQFGFRGTDHLASDLILDRHLQGRQPAAPSP